MSKTKVAVYGTLKQGHGNHTLLRDATYIGATVTEPTFTMYNLGAFPAIEAEGDTPISVEVYEVDDDTFERLDRLEGYPNFYNRRVVDTEYGKAWIYFIQGLSKVQPYQTKIEEGVW